MANDRTRITYTINTQFQKERMIIMKAKSIATIREILQKKVESASYQYKTRKYNLEQKYKTEWLDNEMTEQEKKMLYGDRETLREARELLEDFENHQW